MTGILRSRNVLAGRYVQWFDALMSDHIYKKIELVGSSPNGIERRSEQRDHASWQDDPKYEVV